MKSKVIRFLEDKKNIFMTLVYRKIFLKDAKPLSIKEDTDKLNYIKIRFCAQKRHHQESKKAKHGVGRDFCSYLTDAGLLSNMYQ